MQQYLKFLKYINQYGEKKDNRTNTKTKSIFGYQMKFNLKHGFPILTTKYIHIKSIIHELLWFLNGDTNNNYLEQNNVKIWKKWSLKSGELGPIYGEQWRKWLTHEGKVVDQIKEVIKLIKNTPNSRRMIVSSWNPSVLPTEDLSPQENVKQGKAALAPCHTLFQFYVVNKKLSCMLTQRSADAFLGVPFNISSYALLTHMVAQQVNLEVGEFIWSGGDCHIYDNHQQQVFKQLARLPLELPSISIKRKPKSIFEYKYEDFELMNYSYYPSIQAPVAV